MRPSLQDVTERLRHASMAEDGLDVDKLVSDLIQAFVEIDRRLNELERRAGAVGEVTRGERRGATELVRRTD
jgi:hypothetical protein